MIKQIWKRCQDSFFFVVVDFFLQVKSGEVFIEVVLEVLTGVDGVVVVGGPDLVV